MAARRGAAPAGSAFTSGGVAPASVSGRQRVAAPGIRVRGVLLPFTFVPEMKAISRLLPPAVRAGPEDEALAPIFPVATAIVTAPIRLD